MSDPKYVKIGTPAMRIMEEVGEILKALGKGERFGWNAHHPDRPGNNNLMELENEIADLAGAFWDLKVEIYKQFPEIYK